MFYAKAAIAIINGRKIAAFQNGELYPFEVEFAEAQRRMMEGIPSTADRIKRISFRVNS